MSVPGASQQLFIGAQVDDSALQGFSNQIGEVSDNMMMMQKAGFAAAISIGSMLTAIGGGLTAVLGTTVATFGELQKQMRQVQRIAGITNSELDELRGRFIEVSGALPISAQRMASVATNASRLGIKGTEALTEFTKSMIELGNTTTLSAEQATDSLGRLIRQFGASFDEANKFASAMGKISTVTTATSSKLAKFAERTGATASRFGMSAGELFAFGGAADEAGLGARTAGTQFTKLLNRFSQNQEKIENMVPSINNMEKALNNNLTPAIVKFFGHLKTLENSEAQAKLNELNLASQRIIPFISTLTKNHGRLNELLGQGNEAFKEGTFIQEQYQTAINNVVDDARTLIGTFGNIAKVIGGTLAPIARVILQSLNAVGQAFLSMPSILQGAIGLFIGLVGIVILITGVLMTLGGVLGVTTIGLKGLAKSIAGANANIVDLIPAIVTLLGRIKAFNGVLMTTFSVSMLNATDAVRKLAVHMWKLGKTMQIEAIVEFGRTMMDNANSVARVTSSIGRLASAITGQLTAAFQLSIPIIGKFFKNLFKLNFGGLITEVNNFSTVWGMAFSDMASSMKNNLGGAFSLVKNQFLSFAKTMKSTMTSMFGPAIVSKVIGFFTLVHGWLMSLLTSIPLVGTAFNTAFFPIVGVVTLIAGAIFLLKDIIIEVVSALWGAFKGIISVFTALKNGVTEGFMTVFKPLKNSVNLFIETLGRLFNVFTGGGGEGASHFLGIIKAIGQAIGFISTTFLIPFIALFRVLTGVVEGVIQAVRSFMEPIMNMIITPLADSFSKLFDSLNTLGNAFSSMFSSAKEEAGILQTITLVLTALFKGLGYVVTAVLSPIIVMARWINWMAERIEDVAWAFGQAGGDQSGPPDTGPSGIEGQEIPGLATGGIVTRKTPAMVAENGPEAVLPLDKLDSIMSQGSGKITIENHVSLDGRTVSKSVNKVDEDNNTRQYSRPQMGVTG